MKIDFENYEITVADGLGVIYASEDIKAKCKEWLKGKCKDKAKRMIEEKNAEVPKDILDHMSALKDEDWDEMSKANIFMFKPYDETEMQSMDEMMEQVSWGFNPVVGAFTVGHSLLKFGDKNLNQDIIPVDKADYYTKAVCGQACTWEHEMDILIGAVMNATTHYPSGTLLMNTRFWEARPESAGFVEEVRKRYANKDLKFSFEVMTAKVACSSCGNEYPARVAGKTDHYCSCLKSRFEAGSQVGRIMVDFIPIGEGVVSTPAFSGSKALIAANKTEVARLAQAVNELNNLLKSKIR